MKNSEKVKTMNSVDFGFGINKIEGFDPRLTIEEHYNRHFRVNFDPLEASLEENPDLSEETCKLFKGIGLSNCGLVVWKIMQYIFYNYKLSKDEKKKKKIEKRINEIQELQNDDVIELDDDGNIIAHDRVSRAGSSVNELTQQKDIESLRAQVKALARETQRLRRQANWKRQCAFMLAGVSKALDPVFEKSRQRITDVCRPLENIRKTIKDDKTLKRLFIEVGGYQGEVLFKRGDKGSKLKLETYKNIDSQVRKDCLEFLEDIRHESRSYRTHISKYGDLVQVLADANPMIYKIKKLNKKEFAEEKVRRIQEGIDENELEFGDYLAPKPEDKEEIENQSLDLESRSGIDEIWEIKSERPENEDIGDIFANMKILTPEEQRKKDEEEERKRIEAEKKKITGKDIDNKFISLIMKVEQGRIRDLKRKEKEEGLLNVEEEEEEGNVEDQMEEVPEDIEVVEDVNLDQDGLLPMGKKFLFNQF